MRTLIVVAAIIALVSASATYTPPKRSCHWNVELSNKDSGKVKYYINGLFFAKWNYDANGNLLEHVVLRPDITNTSTFSFKDGVCKKGVSLITVDRALVEFFAQESTWTRSENTKYNGKDVTKYSGVPSIFSLLGDVVIYEDNRSHEIVAITVKLLTSATTYDVKIGGKAWMSDFAFSSKESGCDAENLYKAGDDHYAFCGASSVKAALALVLATIAMALLSLF